VFYVTDLRHFEGIELDPEAPAPALRLARYLYRIVSAATATAERGPHATALPCRRRPGRLACPGRLVVEMQDQPPRIGWECPACGEAGSIEGWQGQPSDLSGVAQADEEGQFMSVVLPEKTYQLLLDELYIDRHYERLLYSARLGPGGVELSGPEEDFEELEGVVAFEANHAPTKKAQRRWDDVFDHLEPSRRTWIEHSTDVVLDELNNFGLVVARPQAADLVRQRVAAVATGLGISKLSPAAINEHEGDMFGEHELKAWCQLSVAAGGHGDGGDLYWGALDQMSTGCDQPPGSGARSRPPLIAAMMRHGEVPVHPNRRTIADAASPRASTASASGVARGSMSGTSPPNAKSARTAWPRRCSARRRALRSQLRTVEGGSQLVGDGDAAHPPGDLNASGLRGREGISLAGASWLADLAA
jgi:hypothetical protein